MPNISNSSRSVWTFCTLLMLSALLSLSAGCFPPEGQIVFSPDGQEIACTSNRLWTNPAMEDDVQPFASGSSQYRLFRVPLKGKPVLVEESTDHLLSTPCYSPDGKRLMYLRVPLDQIALYETTSDRNDIADTSEPLSLLDAFQYVIIGREGAKQCVEKVSAWRTFQAELVLRDLAADTPPRSIPLEIPDFAPDSPVFLYAVSRPYVSPEGKTALVSTGTAVLRVELKTYKVERLLACPGGFTQAVPSADGKTLAVATLDSVVLVDLEAKRMIVLPEEHQPAIGWLGPDSLLIYANRQLREINREGKLRRIRRIESEDVSGTMFRVAVSPDGQRIALEETGAKHFLLDSEGRILNIMESDDESPQFSPAFSPDSKTLAIKAAKLEEYEAEGEDAEDRYSIETRSLLLFNADGKFRDQLAIPPSDFVPPDASATLRAKEEPAGSTHPLAGQTVLVFPEAPVEDEDVEFLITSLTGQVASKLRQRIDTMKSVEYSALRDAKAKEGFNQLAISEVGKQLGADVVLYLRIERFTLGISEDSKPWEGLLVARLRAVDVRKGRIWPKDKPAGRQIRIEDTIPNIGEDPARRLSLQMIDALSSEAAALLADSDNGWKATPTPADAPAETDNETPPQTPPADAVEAEQTPADEKAVPEP